MAAMNPTQKPDPTAAALADLTPADILRCTARYLERHGWIQGNAYQPDTTDPFPAACAIGAITISIYGGLSAPVDRQERHDAWRLVNRVTAQLAEYLWTDGRVKESDYYGAMCSSAPEIVAGWNDDSTQALADVLDILRAAADDHDRTHGGTR
ncbi:hypothetical protein O7626_30705 [Micromonospora sp. WMMD1102]|uniref:DUF6197 family protein n=1 Tax=Micromonospora sp. WMMD1102 TaxID=3016105 RepID=UPI00241551F0|nr:hypothetical protein [Micromonospora sp. WMMD1102]MDG4790243.1 hypothetical protein [Micromonospora sp. WMMD1102]